MEPHLFIIHLAKLILSELYLFEVGLPLHFMFYLHLSELLEGIDDILSSSLLSILLQSEAAGGKFSRKVLAEQVIVELRLAASDDLLNKYVALILTILVSEVNLNNALVLLIVGVAIELVASVT